MYPYPILPKPLSATKFYVLLALCRGESTRYQLKNIMHNDSFGSLKVSDTQLYRTVRELEEEALIENSREIPGRVEGTKTAVYEINHHGVMRLKEEMIRLEHAVKIARHAGVMDDATPIELQKLRLDLLDRREG